MPRLRRKHLPHLVNVTPFLGDGAEGPVYGPKVTGVPAYVEQKSRLVVDRRAASPSAGTEIVSSTRVVLLPDNDVLPSSLVTVWPGTPRERTSEVVASALGMYSARTPNHVEADLE